MTGAGVGRTESVILYGPDPGLARRTGGVASHMRYLETGLRDRGVRPTTLHTDWPAAEELPLPAAVQRGIGVVRSSAYLLVRQWPPDTVVHVNSSLYPRALLRDLPFVETCASRRLPVLLQFHGGRLSGVEAGPGGRVLARRLVGHAHRIAVFPGPQLAEFGRAVDDEKLIPVVNMVPATPGAVHEGPARFLFLGALTREKGVDTLVKAYLKLAGRLESPPALELAGRGPLADEIRRRLAASSHGASVTLHGFLEGEELGAAMRRCSVLVLPSEREGFPLAFLECAERGMASIVTRASAVPSLFEEGTEYLGVEPGDVPGLSRAMERLATDAVLRRAVGRQAREAVHRCCTVEAATPQYLEAYAETLAAASARPT